jgi:hypothetical protein
MQAAHANFGLGGIVGPFLVGYLKYKLAFALLGCTSCFTLILTLLQMLYDHSMMATRTTSSVNYDNLEDDNQAAIVTRQESSSTTSNEQLNEDNNGGVEMSLCVNSDLNDISSNGGGGKKVAAALDPAVLHPPFVLKLLLSSFFFIYVGIEIGYGGTWV